MTYVHYTYVYDIYVIIFLLLKNYILYNIFWFGFLFPILSVFLQLPFYLDPHSFCLSIENKQVPKE